MLVDIQLTDKATKETFIYPDEYSGWGEGEDNTPEHQIGFMWGDGNFACDCNRYLFFTAAKTGDWPDGDDDTSCGHEKYHVRIVERGTGKLVYEDSDD